MKPSTLKALADGDIDNAIISETPGGTEAQEARGQQDLVASSLMPKKMHPSREAYETLDFVFGDDADDIFVHATLPQGWTRHATDHSMHSDIRDDQGRRRVRVVLRDGDTEIETIGKAKPDDFTKLNLLQDEAAKALSRKFPDYMNPLAYWQEEDE